LGWFEPRNESTTAFASEQTKASALPLKMKSTEEKPESVFSSRSKASFAASACAALELSSL
jgi:hypothetical protein